MVGSVHTRGRNGLAAPNAATAGSATGAEEASDPDGDQTFADQIPAAKHPPASSITHAAMGTRFFGADIGMPDEPVSWNMVTHTTTLSIDRHPYRKG